MTQFLEINSAYKKYFRFRPPTRACVSIDWDTADSVFIEIVGSTSGKSAANLLHVQSISYWAPANIGPYSQSCEVPSSINDGQGIHFIHYAGQIGLKPEILALSSQDINEQLEQTLKNYEKVFEKTNGNLSSVYC